MAQLLKGRLTTKNIQCLDCMPVCHIGIISARVIILKSNFSLLKYFRVEEGRREAGRGAEKHIELYKNK